MPFGWLCFAGSESDPGLTPRGVYELFNILDRDSAKCNFKVEVYMLELYVDDLQDLLADVPRGQKHVSVPAWQTGKVAGCLSTLWKSSELVVTSSFTKFGACYKGGRLFVCSLSEGGACGT